MNWYPLGIGALIVAIAVVAYYANKPGNQGSCLPGPPRPCPDAWKDEAGNPVAATVVCDPSTLQPKAPNYGPGKCQVACPAGAVPCWTKAGGVCHTGAACPCQADKDCPGHGLCNTTTGCSCQPGYLAPECTAQGSCTDDKQCGPHGKCAADRQSCVCDDGWGPPTGAPGGPPPCSACLPGRGPGGGDCSKAWSTHTIRTRDCWYSNSDANCQADPLTGFTMGQRGPGGEGGYTWFEFECDTSAAGACNCRAGDNTHLCSVRGWLQPNQKDDACNDEPRSGSAYYCH